MKSENVKSPDAPPPWHNRESFMLLSAGPLRRFIQGLNQILVWIEVVLELVCLCDLPQLLKNHLKERNEPSSQCQPASLQRLWEEWLREKGISVSVLDTSWGFCLRLHSAPAREIDHLSNKLVILSWKWWENYTLSFLCLITMRKLYSSLCLECVIYQRLLIYIWYKNPAEHAYSSAPVRVCCSLNHYFWVSYLTSHH